MVGDGLAAALDVAQGRCHSAVRVGQGEADAARAEVDAEDPAHALAAPQRGAPATVSVAWWRTRPSASSTASTFGPPPETTSALLAVPPPSALAAGAAISAAETPRSRWLLVTATAMPAFLPSGPTPTSDTMPDPNASRVASASRRSPPGSRPSR